METFSALLALCAGNSLVTAEFPSQRPLMWSFDVYLQIQIHIQKGFIDSQYMVQQLEQQYMDEAMYISLIGFSWYCTKIYGFE